MRWNGPVRAASVMAATTAIALIVAPAASAAGDDVRVVNTETVQVYTDATGRVETKRVYEQLSLTGTGSVDMVNPIETDGLRNLDGFGGFEVKDGNQVAEISVDGAERLRSVSSFDGKLPLEVKVQYFLDDKQVQPGDVVGADGRLDVVYSVRNVTSAPQEVSFDDGSGGTITKTVEVPSPLVGSLSTTAPRNFTNVTSESANMAGDGKGGTKLSFTMTLFPPLGSDTAEFGYSANITDGVVPRADISALPVNPLESATFKTAATSYQGGADTGAQLAAGATTIDENLLKMRDGAADLLAGLIKLRDGANELSTGLAGEAAPGAHKLADGMTQLYDGVGRLDDGAGQLSDGSIALRDGARQVADGAGQVADGTGKLDDGANRLSGGADRLAAGTGTARTGAEDLSDGLGLISGGLDQLADSSAGLPAAKGGAEQLKQGVELLISKLGTVDEQATLIGGLAKLEAGLGQLEVGSGNLRGGLQVLVGNVPAQSPGLKGAKAGVDQVQTGLSGAIAPGGKLDELFGGLQLIRGAFCPSTGGATAPNGLTCAQLVDELQAGVSQSKTNLTAASGGLGQVSGGLATAIGGLETQLIPGAGQVVAGLTEAKTGAGTLKSGAIEFKGGMQQLSAGVTKLSDGLTTAVDGVLRLSNGAQTAASGGQDLAAGLGQLDAGANELNAGANELAAGTGELNAGAGKLADGAGQVADGSGELAAGAGKLAGGTGDLATGSLKLRDGSDELAQGLDAAADGSGQLADGLGQAADGAPQLVDGAQRLSDEGAKKLVEAGEDTAANFGEMYATIAAGAERADAEKMAYGAPEGATGLTAYSFVVQGEDGEGGRNLARGLTGLALLGAGAAAFALRRRLV
jgi:putative membrane protein